jgi:hypothetical protein
MANFDWKTWAITGLLGYSITFGTWATVQIYASKEINAEQNVKIQQLQVDSGKIFSSIEKVTESVNQMKNELVRQGVILESIEKQLSLKSPYKRDYALKPFDDSTGTNQ